MSAEQVVLIVISTAQQFAVALAAAIGVFFAIYWLGAKVAEYRFRNGAK